VNEYVSEEVKEIKIERERERERERSENMYRVLRLNQKW